MKVKRIMTAGGASLLALDTSALDSDRRNPLSGFADFAVTPPPAATWLKAGAPLSAIATDDAPIPAFLRRDWVRDRAGRKLAAYGPHLALLALLAFRIWPAAARRAFDAARLIEAARTGALICGPRDQSILARAAAGVAGER